MKLKCLPEDFLVEELTTIRPGDRGRFMAYRLTKRGLGTIEAVDEIRRRWNLAPGQVRYGGLKDRHAVTIQYLTILNGPARPLREGRFELEPLGRMDEPYSSNHFRGNRFEVILRDLTEPAAAAALASAEQIPADGLPNYFDDQRFGSVGFDGGFVGHAWLVGDHERALKLAIAAANPHDRAGVKAIKATIRDLWGQWPDLKAALPKSHERSLVTYLVDHPADFRGAFARVHREMRSLYFSAFQSHIWNLMLARHLESITTPERRVMIDFRVATLPIHRFLAPEDARALRSLKLPLPSSRSPLPTGPLGESAAALLAEWGLTWEAMRVRHLKDVFFSKGERPAVFVPEHWQATLAPDDLHPGRRCLTLGFELPRGSYATLVVKRLTDAA